MTYCQDFCLWSSLLLWRVTSFRRLALGHKVSKQAIYRGLLKTAHKTPYPLKSSQSSCDVASRWKSQGPPIHQVCQSETHVSRRGEQTKIRAMIAVIRFSICSWASHSVTTSCHRPQREVPMYLFGCLYVRLDLCRSWRRLAMGVSLTRHSSRTRWHPLLVQQLQDCSKWRQVV